jgi:hypothetical protein
MKKIMKINPEFARNLWLEFSLQRLIIAPVIILLVCGLIFLNAGIENTFKILHYASLGGFIFFCMIWGLKSASDSVLEEYNDKTWDWQKMSIIGPWKLAWGKLFGSTIYQWYVAGVCLLLYIWSSFFLNNPIKELELSLILTVLAVCIHGMMILLSLLMMKRGDGKTKIKSTRVFILGLFLVSFLVRPLSYGFLFNGFKYNIHWYGLNSELHISLVAAMFYCAWMIAGLYRSMRAELQFTDKPTWWTAFLISNIVFLYGYFAGLESFSIIGSLAVTLIASFLQLLIMTYFLALTETKDVVVFRSLFSNIKTRNWNSLLRTDSLWQVTLFIAIGTGIMALLLSIFAIHTQNNLTTNLLLHNQGSLKLTMAFFAIIGFVIRDISILLILHFSRKTRRADAAMILYLIILYALLPSMTHKFGIGVAFFPDFTQNSFLMAAVPLVEGAIAFYFLREKWKQVQTIKNLT